jgi:hypothetical protein
MAKQALSVTLEADNVTWLKGRAGRAGVRSVSELLDRLVSAARQSGDHEPARSVVGTIDIDPGDPMLTQADNVVRAMFDRSLGRPLHAKEASPQYTARRPRSKKRRG